MRVAFDSRAATHREVGRYSQCLLQALRDAAGEEDEVVETHRPRAADVFHAPWLQGAALHSPCPMVVTLHDLAPLERPSERLRAGGMHLRLRHLAVQRAVQVIVPTEALARETVAKLGLERERVAVIPEAHDAAAAPPAWTWQDAAHETWQVYRRALAHPHRPCVTVWRRPQGLGGPRTASGPASMS
jgi:Glycosyltransferase Family 4